MLNEKIILLSVNNVEDYVADSSFNQVISDL